MATFSRAKYYRNMKGQDGAKIWQAVQNVGLEDELTEKECQKLVSISQTLENLEKDHAAGKGKFSCTMDLASGETERGVVDSDTLYRNERADIYDELDRLLAKYPKWVNGTPFLQKKSKISSKFDGILAEFKDQIATRVDAMHTLYLTYQQSIRDMSASELADYRAECRKVVENHQAAVANASSRILAHSPMAQAALEGPSREFIAIARGHLESYKAENAPMIQVVDSWEELLPADTVSYTAPDLSSTEVREKFLGNVKVTTPFSDEVTEVIQSASHPEMHASRVAASMMMYFNAFKKARALLEHDARARPVVFDMGAGVYGGEKLLLMKRDPKNVGVYVHAAIPTADVEDINRVTRMRTNPTFLTWNDVSVTHTPSTTRLNWCRHKARDCTCMGHYTHVFVVCVHSAYYFTQEDFERIFEHTSSFESLEHIPEVGNPVPLDKPEYIWENACEKSEHANYSLLGRFANKVRATMTQTAQVRLQPLVTAATTYTHPDNGERLRRGGMHFNKWSRIVDRVTEDNGKLASFAAGVAAAGALGGALGAIGRSATGVLGSAAYGALSSLATTTIAAALCKLDTKQRQPWLPGDYSVETSVAMSYENNWGDQTCHIIRYTKMPRGVALEPRVTVSEKPDITEVGRVAAALATTADGAKTERMMAAVLLRDKKPARAVKATLKHANRVVNFLFPPAPDVQNPPWLLKSALAVACQPLVSGVCHQAASVTVAAFCPSRLYQPCKIAYLLVTFQPATVIYLLLVAPLHLIGLWGLMCLTDRLLSA